MTDVLVITTVDGPKVTKALELIQKLTNLCCKVQFHHLGRTKTLERIDNFLGDKKSISPALIVYMGNGDRGGWKISESESVSYWELRKLLCEHNPKRRLSILNDTPFGQMLIKELIGERDPFYTSCIAQIRFAKGLNIGEITALAVECWAEGLRPEQKISALAPGELGAYHTLPIWQRWGEHFEELFLNQHQIAHTV